MKGLVWNCRRLGHPRSARELAETVRIRRPDLVGLLDEDRRE
ncbi:unnamed protein product [Rhodiola kirilowii]